MDNVTGKCAECGNEMHGRTDRKFCSAACRQKAYRNRDVTLTVTGMGTDAEFLYDILQSLRFMRSTPRVTGLSSKAKKLIIDELNETAAELDRSSATP